MAEAYSWEIRNEAYELYVVDGHTYDQVAKITGVSTSQLKRWGKEDDWREKRREYREALGEIKRKTVLLRRDLLDKAMGLDPQHIYAFAKLEQVAAAAAKGQSKPQMPMPVAVDELHFATPGDAVAALDEAVQRKIAELVSVSGSLDLNAIKNMKQALELLEQMKSKYSPEEEKAAAGGLSDEAADDIRSKILGIS